jgi:hypothetical protein
MVPGVGAGVGDGPGFELLEPPIFAAVECYLLASTVFQMRCTLPDGELLTVTQPQYKQVKNADDDDSTSHVGTSSAAAAQLR